MSLRSTTRDRQTEREREALRTQSRTRRIDYANASTLWSVLGHQRCCHSLSLRGDERGIRNVVLLGVVARIDNGVLDHVDANHLLDLARHRESDRTRSAAQICKCPLASKQDSPAHTQRCDVGARTNEDTISCRRTPVSHDTVQDLGRCGVDLKECVG